MHLGMLALRREKAITVPRPRGQQLLQASWFESVGLKRFLACFFGRIGVTRSPGVLERTAPKSFRSEPVVDVAVVLPRWLEHLPFLLRLTLNQLPAGPRRCPQGPGCVPQQQRQRAGRSRCSVSATASILLRVYWALWVFPLSWVGPLPGCVTYVCSSRFQRVLSRTFLSGRP